MPPQPNDQLAALSRLAVEGLQRLFAETDIVEIDDDGLMRGRDVDLVTSVRSSALATPGDVGERHVEGIVAYATGSRGGLARDYAESVKGHGDPRSFHVWIDERGGVAQSVPFGRAAWHAPAAGGAFKRDPSGEWSRLLPQQRGIVRGYSANGWSAAIVFENAGEVRRVGDAWLGDPRWAGRQAMPDDEVEVSADDPARGHHRYSKAQVAAAVRVYGALVRRYALLRANCERQADITQPRLHGQGGVVSTVLDAVFGVTS